MSEEVEYIIPDYAQVSAETRQALEPYIADGQISQITTEQAHNVVETSVVYLRGSEVHEIVYDETNQKLLGGTEPAVIEKVIAQQLPESGQRRVRESGEAIRKIKIKHDESDDREYIHVHYVSADGLMTNYRLEFDGSPKGKSGKTEQIKECAEPAFSEAVQTAFQAALAALPEAERQTVYAGGDRVRQVKMKRKPHKAFSQIDVHYLDAENRPSRARCKYDGERRKPSAEPTSSLQQSMTQKEQSMSQEIERVIAEYAQVSIEARKAFDSHIAGAQISKITAKEAHGTAQTKITYLRGTDVHDISYDATTGKLLCGSEPAAIEQIVAGLPEACQHAVREGGQNISHIKIKHDDADDREYVHVHYHADDGEIISRKLELDGSDKDAGKKKPQEIEHIIPSYDQLSAEARAAFDPHLEGAQISQIVQAEAHGVVEMTVVYLRGTEIYEIIYDETSGKLLGGNEPAVIEKVIAILPESGQRRVREGGERFHQFKIKHDEHDDREYVHVHYMGDDGIFSRKLELDGRDKGKTAA